MFKQTNGNDEKVVESFKAADLKILFGEKPGKNAKRNMDKRVMAAIATSWHQINSEESNRTILSPYFTEVRIIFIECP